MGLLVAVCIVEVVLVVVFGGVLALVLPLLFRSCYRIAIAMWWFLLRCIVVLVFGLPLILILQCTAALWRSVWAYCYYYIQRARLRGTQESCPVCLADFQEEPHRRVRTLECGHCFHA